MTWVEHSLVGAGVFGVSCLVRRRLSPSLLLLGSTLLPDLDHLWFRLASRSLLPSHPSIELGFWLGSGTWTHSVFALVLGSWAASRSFEDRRNALHSFLWGWGFHLLGDWLYRGYFFGKGLLWLWPFTTAMF